MRLAPVWIFAACCFGQAPTPAPQPKTPSIVTASEATKYVQPVIKGALSVLDTQIKSFSKYDKTETFTRDQIIEYLKEYKANILKLEKDMMEHAK